MGGVTAASSTIYHTVYVLKQYVFSYLTLSTVNIFHLTNIKQDYESDYTFKANVQHLAVYNTHIIK